MTGVSVSGYENLYPGIHYVIAASGETVVSSEVGEFEEKRKKVREFEGCAPSGFSGPVRMAFSRDMSQ